MTRFMAEVVVPMVLALVLAILATDAWPHAVLLQSTPADGVQLEGAPAEATLRFNEPVEPLALRIIDRNGRNLVAPGSVSSEDQVVRVRLPSLDNGSYTFSYRVVSGDGHVVSGASLFGVGEPAGTPAADGTVPENASSWNALKIASRGVFLVAFLGALGMALFYLFVSPQTSGGGNGVFTALAILALATGMLCIGAHGAEMLDAHGLLEHAAWRAGLHASTSHAMCIALVGLAIAAVGLRIGRRVGKGLIGFGALAALGSVPLSGHAATASPAWIALPLWSVHAAIAAFWVGSFYPLVRSLGAGNGVPTVSAAATVRRFSRIAMIIVPVLIGAGVAMAMLQVPAVRGLVHTSYGLLLCVKLALVALLLGLAAYNRFALTPRLERGDDAARQRLRATIWTEVVVALCILAATAVLSQQRPPRTIPSAGGAGVATSLAPASTAAESTAVELTATAKGYTAKLSVSPGRAGRNALGVRFLHGGEHAVAPMEATLEIANPGAGIEPLTRRLEQQGDSFTHAGSELSIPGTWRIHVSALITDFEKVGFDFEVVVRP